MTNPYSNFPNQLSQKFFLFVFVLFLHDTPALNCARCSQVQAFPLSSPVNKSIALC